MIVIAGWIDVEPSVRDEAVAATVPYQLATRTDELGCVSYVMSADPALPGRIQIFEAWADADALEAHFGHPNFTATGALIRSYPRVGGSIRKYRVGGSGPIAGPDGRPSATYWED